MNNFVWIGLGVLVLFLVMNGSKGSKGPKGSGRSRGSRGSHCDIIVSNHGYNHGCNYA